MLRPLQCYLEDRRMQLLPVSVTQTVPKKLVILGFRDLRCHCRSHQCHFSAPLALGDRRELIEPSRCQDFVWETMVT